jgi:hypothetical protein
MAPSSRFSFLIELDPFRKPVPTPDQVRGRLFRDHALPFVATRVAMLFAVSSVAKALTIAPASPLAEPRPVISPPSCRPLAGPAQQHGELPLLVTIETLVERLSCISDPLEVSGPRCHCIGSPANTVNKIGPRRSGFCVARGTALAPLVGALFDDVTHCGFDSRPILLLLGRQSQACLDSSQAHIHSCGDICGCGPITRRVVRWCALGDSQTAAGDDECGGGSQYGLPHENLLLEVTLAPS